MFNITVFNEATFGKLDGNNLGVHLYSSKTMQHGDRIKICRGAESLGCVPVQYSNPKYFDSIKHSKVAIETNLNSSEHADVVIAFSALYHDTINRYCDASYNDDHVKLKDAESELHAYWKDFYNSHKNKSRSSFRKEVDDFVRERRKEMGLPEDDVNDRDSLNKKGR